MSLPGKMKIALCVSWCDLLLLTLHITTLQFTVLVWKNHKANVLISYWYFFHKTCEYYHCWCLIKATSVLEWGKPSSWHNPLLWTFWVTSGLAKNLQIWIPVLIKWQRSESTMGVIFLILLCSWTYQIWKIPPDAMRYENRKKWLKLWTLAFSERK